MGKDKLFDSLRTALSGKFPATKAQEILYHYEMLIRYNRLGNYEMCLLHGGKFVEAVLKCLHYRRTSEDVDSVRVDYEITQLQSDTSLDASEQLLIPRALRAIYDQRNKRGGAHNNSFDPNAMDAAYVVSTAKWVLEELTRLYYTSDPVAACALVANLLVKEITLVEEIDNDYLVLRPKLSARIQLEMLLYRHYPRRCTTKVLATWLKQAHSEHNVRVTLASMKAKVLVHENENGWKLTDSGVQEAEYEISKLVSTVDKGHERKKSVVKGDKRGRK